MFLHLVGSVSVEGFSAVQGSTYRSLPFKAGGQGGFHCGGVIFLNSDFTSQEITCSDSLYDYQSMHILFGAALVVRLQRILSLMYGEKRYIFMAGLFA